MLSIVTAALLSLPAAPAVGPTHPTPPPRRTLAALEVRGDEAIRFELASPRLDEGELEKVVATPSLRQALNREHLDAIGAVRTTRPCVIGGLLVEPGLYRAGVAFDPRGTLQLTLADETRRLRIPFPGTSGGTHVPQLSVAFLSGAEVEAFSLELRFGSFRGAADLTFAPDEVVTGMNNLAWELLSADDGSRAARTEALRLARRANELTGGTVAGILDTLALAQFENGEVEGAIATQRRAIAAAGADDAETRAALEAQLDRFRTASTDG